MRIFVLIVIILLLISEKAVSQNKQNNIEMENTDHYTFQLNEKVTREKVSFKNRYGITLVGDLYTPKNIGEQKLVK